MGIEWGMHGDFNAETVNVNHGGETLRRLLVVVLGRWHLRGRFVVFFLPVVFAIFDRDPGRATYGYLYPCTTLETMVSASDKPQTSHGHAIASP